MFNVECEGRTHSFNIERSTLNIQHSVSCHTINSRAMDQATINTDIAAAHEVIARLRAEVGRAVIGQEAIVDRLVIALLIRGHVLLEGVPGLAKTLLVKTLAGAIDASFHRIQFTPDLLPADITGTLIFNP